MRISIAAFVAAVVVATSTGLLAQSGSIRLVPAPRQPVTLAERWRPAGITGDTRIVGTILDITQAPVAYAKVQLRSLVTGDVQQEGESDANGEYQFAVGDPGTYVVEMLMAQGHVLALSNAGSIARYETLRTLVQLPGRWDNLLRSMIMPQNNGSFIGMSAQDTMTATTMNMAVDTNIASMDAGEPVSAIR
jgi:hypothetical protein